MSLSNNVLDSATKDTTTVYITQTAQLRTDQDVYMFSIDKCYTTLEQANARVELLAVANQDAHCVETRLIHKDAETGCLMATLGRYGQRARFTAQVKKLKMAGRVLEQRGKEDQVDGSEVTSPNGLWISPSHLDVPGHIWVVAMHHAADGPFERALAQICSSATDSPTTPCSQGSRISSFHAKKLLRTAMQASSVNGVPGAWSIDSIFNNHDAAIARAKQAWNQSFKDKGRCRKLNEHYGFLRFSFKHVYITRQSRDYYTCSQIRVERLRVELVNEKPEYFHSPRSGNGKVVRPPIPYVDGEVISTAAGCRTSFLEDIESIVDGALKPEVKYDLPLATKIRQAHEKRWSDFNNQRFGGTPQRRDRSGDLYHGILYGSMCQSSMSRLSSVVLRGRRATSQRAIGWRRH